jgi:hypothetical protein
MSEVPLYLTVRHCAPRVLGILLITGVPRSSETTPPWDPTVGSCLGSYSGPRGGGGLLMSEAPLY